MQSYSLYELNEYIRRVVALNFTEPIWVQCEIGQVKLSRGQAYLELVQHDEATSTIKAQLSGVIWYKTYLFLEKKLGELLPSLLQDGTQVLIKVKVDFHERYGLKLAIEDIDPSYTIGHLEMARQKVISRLKTEGVIGLNKEVELPFVVQRIAVISSEKAAGYSDFKEHLLSNAYGYDFDLTLFQSALQGSNTEREISAALDQISDLKEAFDCIAIIRGGGSKLDLGAFDNFNISFKIAKHALPVLTGIGHEIDQTAADIVSHKMLKTPTAVADFLIERNLHFEAMIQDLDNQIKVRATQLIHEHSSRLNHFQQILASEPIKILQIKRLELERSQGQLSQSIKYSLDKYQRQLNHYEEILHIVAPKQTLKRGFTIVRQKGNIIEELSHLDTNQSAEIEFRDGEITVDTKS